MTACLWQCIMPTVKTIGNNSLTANLPDNAGELRGREARTAPIVRHNSPALSGFFVRSAQKERYVVETVETKNKLEGLVKQLEEAKGEVMKNTEVSKGIMLADIDLLLAGEEYLTYDVIAQLEEARGFFVEEDSETDEKPESDADAAIEEAVAGSEITDMTFVNLLVADIKKILARTTAEGQKEVLAALQAGQPERTAKYEAEMARDEARDNMLDSVCELPIDAQTKLYRMFHVTVNDSRDELVTEAA